MAVEQPAGGAPASGGVAEPTAAPPRDPAEWVELLADEVGPRRPTGQAERQAAELVAAQLRRAGLHPEVRPFQGYSTFALPYGAVLAMGLLSAIARSSVAQAAMGAAAPALGALEDDLRLRPLSKILARSPSQNVVAAIESKGEARRTACLVCHLDTSRSGLMFHPRLVRWLHGVIAAQSAALAVNAAAPLLRRRPAGRRALAAARAVIAAGLGLLVERELRGEDVPGANDNASGVATVATLAAELGANPLESTRVVVLLTGCEESGLLGADSFIEETDTAGWLFLNFDGVGATAPLHYLLNEGVVRRWPADPGLAEVASAVARRRPDVGLSATDHNAGLTYDTSMVLARAGRALTFSTQGRTIPNYHQPSDNAQNLDRDALGRALEVGREMLAAIDRGEAD